MPRIPRICISTWADSSAATRKRLGKFARGRRQGFERARAQNEASQHPRILECDGHRARLSAHARGRRDRHDRHANARPHKPAHGVEIAHAHAKTRPVPGARHVLADIVAQGRIVVETHEGARCDLGIGDRFAVLEPIARRQDRHEPVGLERAHGKIAERDRVGRNAEIASRPFVGLNDDAALSHYIGQYVARAGHRPRFRVRVRDFDAVCRLVGAGIGVAIVPITAAVRMRRQTRVVPVALEDAWMLRRLVLCARAFETLPTAARKLAEALTRRSA